MGVSGPTAIAEQVADCFAARGYAFVEGDRIDALAAALRAFLAGAGISVQAVSADQGARRAGGLPISR